ncbi:MAG: hypothetical protein E1N59_2653 [Puniceicoccaceae bacterium 5H]|nr:MAG: hypothetical protein E1N59_2653 [Puniceicoccaceae bacterium 5H]
MVLMRSLFWLLFATCVQLHAQVVLVIDAETPADLLAGAQQRIDDEALALDRPVETLTVQLATDTEGLWRLRSWQAVLWLAQTPLPNPWRRTWELEGVKLITLASPGGATDFDAWATGFAAADIAFTDRVGPQPLLP